MKLGIIGAGMIVKEFLPHLVGMEGLEVVAVMARRLEAVQEVCADNGVPHAVTCFDPSTEFKCLRVFAKMRRQMIRSRHRV